MHRIRLELARDQDFPAGSRNHGYEFSAPLDADSHIDKAAWKTDKDSCRVRRFWGNEDDDIDGDEDDDETGYRFGAHAFQSGEYVSIREHDDEMRTFRVVSVREISP